MSYKSQFFFLWLDVILQLFRVNLYSYEEYEKEFLLEATVDELYDQDPRQECQSETFQVKVNSYF